MARPTRTQPGIFNIPANQNFARSLAIGILDRVQGDLLKLSTVTVLLPNRRAVRALSTAFLNLNDGKPMLMPIMRAIGDVDIDEYATLSGSLVGEDILSPAIGDAERRALLSSLVSKWSAAKGGTISAAQAWHLADELARFMDQVEIANLPYTELDGLVAEDFATHWSQTINFLKIVTEQWPTLLSARGMMNPAARRNAQLGALATLWQTDPPQHDIIAAGSTGTVDATANLLKVISRLPKGYVVLPGLDKGMDDVSWDMLVATPSHPQHTMRNLLEVIGENRDNVKIWTDKGEDEASDERMKILSEALRPAGTTEAWRNLKATKFDAKKVLSGMEFALAGSRREEADIIALKLRESIEESGKTAALITADRQLARQVAATMKRWEIEIDDSAGQPALNTSLGQYLRLIPSLFESSFAPHNFLSLLQHPLTRCGQKRDILRKFTRHLDYSLLRGPSPTLGIAGLVSRSEERVRATKAKKIRDPKAYWKIEHHKKLLQVLEPLKAHETLLSKEKVSPLEILISHLELAEKLACEGDSDTGMLWTGQAGRVLADGLREIRNALDGVNDIEPAEYPALFDMMISPYAVRRHYGKHPRVFIWGAIEARLQRADLMVLGGMNEDTWPAETDPDPWMNRKMRKEFGLPPLERRIGQSAHDFVQAMGASEVLVTRSTKLAGAETVPSRWLMRLEAILGADVMYKPIAIKNYAASLHNLGTGIQSIQPPAPTPPIYSRPKELHVTSIEQWMRNPYGLYAKQILNLRPIEKVSDNPNASHKGTLIHDILETFLKLEGDTEGPDGLKRLMKIGREAFDALKDQPAVEAFWWPRFTAIAKAFIEETMSDNAFLDTVAIEVDGAAKLSNVQFTVKARADRIDMLRASGNYIVIDYKTGDPPSKAQMMAGFAPQLPLEAWILAQNGFEGLEGAPVDNGEYWKLSGHYAHPIERKFPIRPIEFEETMKSSVAGLTELVEIFNKPETPYLSRPRPAFVTYDDYGHLARVKEWFGNTGGGT